MDNPRIEPHNGWHIIWDDKGYPSYTITKWEYTARLLVNDLKDREVEQIGALVRKIHGTPVLIEKNDKRWPTDNPYRFQLAMTMELVFGDPVKADRWCEQLLSAILAELGREVRASLWLDWKQPEGFPLDRHLGMMPDHMCKGCGLSVDIYGTPYEGYCSELCHDRWHNHWASR